MVVTMYWSDHARPHFHIRYAEHRAVFSLYVMDFTEGRLPNTQERMIRNWCSNIFGLTAYLPSP